MVFMQHDRDLAIDGAEDGFDMQPDQSAEALFGIDDRTHGADHALLSDLHGVAHDFEQDFVFALKMVVEAAFAEFEGGGDVVHGGSVVSTLLEKTGRGAQNLLTGIEGRFAGHCGTW